MTKTKLVLVYFGNLLIHLEASYLYQNNYPESDQVTKGFISPDNSYFLENTYQIKNEPTEQNYSLKSDFVYVSQNSLPQHPEDYYDNYIYQEQDERETYYSNSDFSGHDRNNSPFPALFPAERGLNSPFPTPTQGMTSPPTSAIHLLVSFIQKIVTGFTGRSPPRRRFGEEVMIAPQDAYKEVALKIGEWFAFLITDILFQLVWPTY